MNRCDLYVNCHKKSYVRQNDLKPSLEFEYFNNIEHAWDGITLVAYILCTVYCVYVCMQWHVQFCFSMFQNWQNIRLTNYLVCRNNLVNLLVQFSNERTEYIDDIEQFAHPGLFLNDARSWAADSHQSTLLQSYWSRYWSTWLIAFRT